MPYVPTFAEIMDLYEKIVDLDLSTGSDVRTFGEAVVEWAAEMGLEKNAEAAAAYRLASQLSRS